MPLGCLHEIMTVEASVAIHKYRSTSLFGISKILRLGILPCDWEIRL
jgi:hypothetical protein